MTATGGGVADPIVHSMASSEGTGCRLLIVEDHPPDAALIVARLRRADLAASIRVADDRATFEAALADPPDLILCDFALPGFDAFEALDLLRDRSLDIPLIVVSGALADDEAIECLRRGAVDYLLKDRPARLVSAIQRALDDHRHRTAMHRSEAAFRDRAGLLQAVFETAADPIVVVDDDGRIVELNSAARRLCETPVERPDGAQDHAVNMLQDLFRRVGRGDSTRGEVEVEDRDSGRRILEYTADRGLLADRHLVVLHDVTVQRALLVDALERHRLESVGRLAGGIAHDFNNILAAIVTFAELALAEMPPDGPGRAEIDAILHAADHASDLVRKILAFGRQQWLQPTVVDVRDVVDSLDSILRRPLGSHIVLAVEATHVPATVFADRAQLEQVIVNLVVNARDALPDGGRITIRIGHEQVGPETDASSVVPGRYVRLEVIDTGTGMDTATKARIFDPFFTTKPQGRGTGLGLATAYGTVQQLGGSIAVDSEPGQGSRFVILVPGVEPPEPALAEPATEPEEEAQGAASGRAGGSSTGRDTRSPETAEPPTILIAEDDPAVRSVLTRILAGGGFRTLVAADGLEALSLAHGTAGIDLLVTDVVMPGVTGPALADRLLDEGRVRRVLLISGYPGVAPIPDLELDPRVAFLPKPFDVTMLRDAVTGLLAS